MAKTPIKSSVEPDFLVEDYLRAVEPVLSEMTIEDIRNLVKEIEAGIARSMN